MDEDAIPREKHFEPTFFFGYKEEYFLLNIYANYIFCFLLYA